MASDAHTQPVLCDTREGVIWRAYHVAYREGWPFTHPAPCETRTRCANGTSDRERAVQPTQVAPDSAMIQELRDEVDMLSSLR